jgi:tRNA-dihydrouridine synthase
MSLAQILFQKNPDLHTFCVEVGIEAEFVLLINTNTVVSKKKAADLILQNNFTDILAKKIYAEQNRTVIIGNGDVMNREEGINRAKESGVDGIMIGRGIFRNPWAFLPLEISQKLNTKENRLEMLLEHLQQWKLTWEDQKHFPAMKKFVKMYINDFPNAKELRMTLMDMENADEMIRRVKEEVGC